MVEGIGSNRSRESKGVEMVMAVGGSRKGSEENITQLTGLKTKAAISAIRMRSYLDDSNLSSRPENLKKMYL